jgi:lipopolysaccharide/colanic/teichoic acid biosynthesis glycosyltransferase
VSGVNPLVAESRLRKWSRRAVDLLVLAAAAPAVLPLVLVLAALVRLDSPGPAFVRHTRIGRGGRRFELLKLRTMVENAEELKERLRHLNVLPWPDFKIPNDPRVTRTGRILRKTSLDELPQLWNLLRGDMTLVGPRPCSISLDRYDLWQTERLEATPGLIGIWQAHARGRVSFRERCSLDIRQIRSLTVRGAVVLGWATLAAVLTGRGAT